MRRPRRLRNRAGSSASVVNRGRAFSQARTAFSAGVPTGSQRVLLPLPVTTSWAPARSMLSRLRLISSASRSPQAYSSSSIA